MSDMTGYAFAADARVAPHATAPIGAPFQGRAVSAAVIGITPVWRLRGQRATTPSDSVSGALPA